MRSEYLFLFFWGATVSKHSSTSNSDASSSDERAFGSGFPWALLLSLLLVAGVEVLFRVSDPLLRVPIERVSGRQRTVIQIIEAGGATDVCFVGSSRTRHGIMIPEVRARSRSKLVHDYSIANFAMGGFHAGATSDVVSKLLDHGSPILVLYGFSCNQLIATGDRFERFAFFWRLDEWFKQFRERGMEVVHFLPAVVRHEVGDVWLTLKYRQWPTSVLQTLLNAYQTENVPFDPVAAVSRNLYPNPLLGGLTPHHKYHPDERLSDGRISVERVKRFAARAIVDGRFNFGDDQVDNVRRIARLCRERGVSLVFFEIPISEILARHFPANTVERTRDIFVDVAREEGVVIYTLDDYGIEWTDDLFREQSHLGNDGALKLSTWLADHAIVPLLRDGEDSAADGG
jgi:hypothetical protein